MTIRNSPGFLPSIKSKYKLTYSTTWRWRLQSFIAFGLVQDFVLHFNRCAPVENFPPQWFSTPFVSSQHLLHFRFVPHTEPLMPCADERDVRFGPVGHVLRPRIFDFTRARASIRWPSSFLTGTCVDVVQLVVILWLSLLPSSTSSLFLTPCPACAVI
jgi:hypothetical protein